MQEENHESRPQALSSVRDTFLALSSRPILLGLLLYITGRSCTIILFASFLPILLLTRHAMDGTQTGIIMAAATVTTALALRPMGRLADPVSRIRLIIIGGLMVSLLYALIPLAATFAQMLVLAILIALFGSMTQPASSALLIEEGKHMGTGFTVGLFTTMLNLGFVLGSLAGGLLLSFAGINSLFSCACGIGMASILLFFWFTRTSA